MQGQGQGQEQGQCTSRQSAWPRVWKGDIDIEGLHSLRASTKAHFHGTGNFIDGLDDSGMVQPHCLAISSQIS